MKTVYFQTLSGASGDMILASLVDLGVPVEFVESELARTGVKGLSVKAESVARNGIACSHMIISFPHQHAHRRLADLLDLVRAGGFKRSIALSCELVLTRLARAEAKVHNIAVEEVHFHEIGAVDTIVDILGTCLCLDYLGIEALEFSTLTEGHGTIQCDHGVMPVPAPATAEMIQGFALTTLPIATELLTPTGAAILTALGTQRDSGPTGTILKVSYSCGDKVLEGHPNVLRAVLLDTVQNTAGQADTICVLESDMDHVSGEILGFCAERLLSAGALDVSWTPLFMKKGRPGFRLTVMCDPAKREKLIDIIILQTRTLGVRYHTIDRIVAAREPGTATLGGERVDVKRCTYKGKSFTKAEYESLAAIARKTDTPLIDLMERFLENK